MQKKKKIVMCSIVFDVSAMTTTSALLVQTRTLSRAQTSAHSVMRVVKLALPVGT